MIPFKNIPTLFRKKKAHIFKKEKKIRSKSFRNYALSTSYIKVQKDVLKTIKKVEKRKQKNKLIIEPNRFRLFYARGTKINKIGNQKKRKADFFKFSHSKKAGTEPLLRRPFLLTTFLPLRQSLIRRWQKFFKFLPNILYKKRVMRKKQLLKNPQSGIKRLFYSTRIKNKAGTTRAPLSLNGTRPSKFLPHQKVHGKQSSLLRASPSLYKTFYLSRSAPLRNLRGHRRKRF